MEIKNIAIVGMGALGLLYGDLLTRDPGLDVGFVVNGERRRRYAEEPVRVNGEPRAFRLLSAEAPEKCADLVIFAVKATALEQAMDDAAGYVGPDTVLLSLLNGITSERILEARFGQKNVVYCVAQGMDAVRQARTLRYAHTGTLCLGLPDDRDPAALNALARLLDRAHVPHAVESDIVHRLWSKFMLNVGLNQVLMVCEGNYGTLQHPGAPRQRMIAAMREVLALAQCEGVAVTEADLQMYVDMIDTLDPEGMPSMRQDGLARRKSEVELFSGTVCRMACSHGLPVPVNEALYREIQSIESGY